MGLARVDKIQQLDPEPGDLKNAMFSVDDIRSIQRTPVDTNDIDLTELLQIPPKQIDEWRQMGKIGYVEEASKTPFAFYVPILGSAHQAAELIRTKTAMDRIQKNEYKDKVQRNKDMIRVGQFLRDQAEIQVRGYKKGALIQKGLTWLPDFMVGIGLAKGAAKGAGMALTKSMVKAGMKGLAQSATKKAAVATAAWATRAAVYTGTVGVPGMVGKFQENEMALNLRMTDKGMRLNEEMRKAPVGSFVKAFVDTYIEYFSEEAGELIVKPVGAALLKASPTAAKLVGAITAKFQKLFPDKSVREIWSRTNWDGMPAEYLEEVFGDELRALFGVQDFGAKDPDNPLDRMIAAIPDQEQFLVTLGVLAVPMAGGNLVSGAQAIDQYNEAKRRLKGGDISGVEVTGEAPNEEDLPPLMTMEGGKQVPIAIAAEAFDPAQAVVDQAQQPLPEVELSAEQIQQLVVETPEGQDIEFKALSREAPARGEVEAIKESKEYQEADEAKKVDLLVKGRTKMLDTQRTAIEKRMTRLEKEVRQRNKEGKPVEQLQQELEKLSQALMSVHAQFANIIDMTTEEVIKDLSGEDVQVKGTDLESLRSIARAEAKKQEQARMKAVFKNMRATEEERRTALVKYLQARLPGKVNADIRDRYSLRAAKNMTENKLQKMFAEIEDLRETLMAKDLRKRAARLAERFAPKLDSSDKKVGAFGKDAPVGLNERAAEVARVVGLSRPEVDAELLSNLEKLRSPELTPEAEDEFLYRNMLLSMVGGLEEKNVDGLEDAITFLANEYNRIKAGARTGQNIRQKQRELLHNGVKGSIVKGTVNTKGIIRSGLKAFTEGVRGAFAFQSFNLAHLWHGIDGQTGRGKTFIQKMIVDALDRIPSAREGFRIIMNRPVRAAMARIYGIPETNNRQYVKFLMDRSRVDPKDTDPATAPYIREKVELNNGEMQDLELSRFEVLYWYAVSHTENGEQDAQAYEILTNENQLADIQAQVERELGEDADPEAIEDKVNSRRGEVKGNAIPIDILEDMFSQLTKEDKAFAHEVRKAFTSFWPLVNTVYRRATGIDMTRIESYIPWVRKAGRHAAAEDMLDTFTIVGNHVSMFPGAVKERNPKAKAPFQQIGLMEVHAATTESMSHFLASYDVMHRVSGLLRDKTIQAAVNKATDGKQNKQTGEWDLAGNYLRLMEFHLDGIRSRGATDADIVWTFFRGLRNNLNVFYLTEPSKAVLQTSSFWTAMPMIGPGAFFKNIGHFLLHIPSSIKFMEKAMSMSSRDRNIMVEMRDIARALQQKGVPEVRTWRDYALGLVRYGNRVGVYLGGWAVLKHYYDQTGDMAKAYEKFDEFTTQTQQSAEREQLSKVQTGFFKYVWQFFGAVAQYTRIYYKSWDDVSKGRISIQQHLNTMLTYHVFIPLMRYWMRTWFLPKDDDEEEANADFWRNAAKEMMKGPFSGFYVIGDILDIVGAVAFQADFFDSGPAMIQQLNRAKKNLTKTLERVMDGEIDNEDLSNIFQTGKHVAGAAFGLPAYLSDIVRILFEASQGEWEADDTPAILYGHSIEAIEYQKDKIERDKRSRRFVQ